MVDLFSYAVGIKKITPKFDRRIKNINKLPPVVAVDNFKFIPRDRYKCVASLDLSTLGIMDGRSRRTGNSVNGFITTTCNFKMLRRRRNFAANRNVAVLQSKGSFEISTVLPKLLSPVLFELLTLLWRQVFPNPISDMPRSYSGIECVKIEFVGIVFRGMLIMIDFPFQFTEEIKRSFKTIGGWSTRSFHIQCDPIKKIPRNSAANSRFTQVGR